MSLVHLSARDLETRARTLDAQIKKIEHHPRPTPNERERAAELKRQRLATKDRLASLGRR